MKAISAGLKAHYAKGTTTLCTCWKATLTNGTVVAATSLDRDVVFSGITYKAAQGYSPSDIESTSDLAPDNLEIEGVLASPAIRDEDIHSGLWDYAEIEIFEVNYSDLTQGRNILRSGRLGEVRGGRSKFAAELRGLMQAYTRVIVRLIEKDCTADLGDSRCKVDLAAITVSGAVESIDSNQIIYDSTRSEPTNWFTGAKITFTSGENEGRSMEVFLSDVGLIKLAHPMYAPIEPGDTYSVHAGCLKRFQEDCVGKHSNGVNFRGFPDLPGSKIYRTGGVNYSANGGGSGGGGGGGNPGDEFPQNPSF